MQDSAEGSMRAAVHATYGPPDVARIMEVARPTADHDELLVKVRATTVNRTDCATRAGKPFFARIITGLIRPKMTILGNEFAGDVVSVGKQVTSFNVGDRVFGYCEGPFGAHAEYLTIPQGASVATIPAGWTYEQIVPATEGAHYALAFIRRMNIHAGQDVLVNGATGGIGSATVQLAKSLGANVTGVCDADNTDLVRGLGADRVIDYTKEDFTTDAQRYDAVLDTVGKSSFGECKRLLKPGGAYASSELGDFSQNPFLALATAVSRGKALSGGKRVVFPIPQHDQAMIRYLRGLIESGDFKPLIDRTYPLDRVVEAYRYVESGQKIGNVVIAVR